MTTRVRLASVLALAAVLSILPGCGDDPASPDLVDSRDEVAGRSWGATTFTVERDGETTDVLAEGGGLHIFFHRDGTASGDLSVPGGAEDGGDLQASMEGTWSVTNRGEEGPVRIELDQDADTFVRDTEFVGGAGVLRGRETFGGTTVTVVLQPLQL